MTTRAIAAVILVILGVMALGYSGIAFTTRGEAADFRALPILQHPPSSLYSTGPRSICARRRRDYFAFHETQTGLMSGVESCVGRSSEPVMDKTNTL